MYDIPSKEFAREHYSSRVLTDAVKVTIELLMQEVVSWLRCTRVDTWVGIELIF